MKAVLLLLVATVYALTAHQQWTEFKKSYGKLYPTAAEEEYRYSVFLDNLVLAAKNQREDPTAEHGVTKFSDLTPEEFRKTYLMPKQDADKMAWTCLQKGVIAPKLNVRDPLPDSFDWRQHNPPVVTPVKDQAQCGSCWAFSVSGAMEGAWALAGNPLVPLSEQESVDCSHGCSNEPPYGPVCNQGCNGGWQWNTYWDLMTPDFNGLMSEKDYPYTARDGTCKKDKTKAVAHIMNYTCLGPDETDMQKWIFEKGPMAIAINADYFQTYRSGISDPSNCQTKQLDHAILIVGWGVGNAAEKNKPYWIIKNSWATSWGEQGYIRQARNKGSCGLNNANNAPLVHYP